MKNIHYFIICSLFSTSVIASAESEMANLNQHLMESKCFATDADKKICLFEDSKMISQEAKDKYQEAYWNGDVPKNIMNAELRFLSKDGEIIDTIKNIFPLVSIKKSNLNINGNPVFLQTIDNSVGMGSYTGLNTVPFTVDSFKINFIKKINLLTSLKSAWKETSDGFLKVICRPDDKSTDDFKITFTRFKLINNQWHITEKSKKGIWENEGFSENIGESSFPKESEFPKAKK